jgi:hypothetical protein
VLQAAVLRQGLQEAAVVNQMLNTCTELQAGHVGGLCCQPAAEAPQPADATAELLDDLQLKAADEVLLCDCSERRGEEEKNSLPPVNWRWVEEGDGYVGRLQPPGQPLGVGLPVGCSAWSRTPTVEKSASEGHFSSLMISLVLTGTAAWLKRSFILLEPLRASSTSATLGCSIAHELS